MLTATLGLLAEGSTFGELNIEQIAKRAGISRTAFYFYFHDKREVLIRLTEKVAEVLYAEADRWWSTTGDGAAELGPALGRVAEMYRQQGALFKAVVEVSTYDQAFAKIWRTVVQQFVDATERRIRIEQEQGRGPDAPARETAFALAWMTERTFYQSLVQGNWEIGALSEAMQAIWIRTIYGSLSTTEN